METLTPQASTGLAALAGKYLTFVLSGECFGIPVLKVREIIRPTAIAAVPQMPHYIKGVINLRGKIIPVIDLCAKFNMRQVDSTESACIVVVEVRGRKGVSIQLGLMVDAVEEVGNFTSGDIEATPDFGTAVDTTCIMAMVKSKGTVKTLLDIDRAVSDFSFSDESLTPSGVEPGQEPSHSVPTL